jgi:hypothetical protein
MGEDVNIPNSKCFELLNNKEERKAFILEKAQKKESIQENDKSVPFDPLNQVELIISYSNRR